MRLLATGLALVILFCIPFAIWGDSFESWLSGEAAIRSIQNSGPWGWLMVIGLLVADLLLPIPATPVMSAAGYVYGAWIGGLLSAVGSFLAGTTGYWLCRLIGRRAAANLAGEDELTAHETLFQRNGPLLVAASRWMPVLPEVMSCLAGLTRMPFPVFAISLACGSVPLGLVYATIGAAGREYPGLAVAMSAILPFLLWFLMKPIVARWREHAGESKPTVDAPEKTIR